MRHRILGSCVVLTAAVIAVILAAAWLAPAAQAQQAAGSAPGAKPYTPPKTPWGDPDIQGIFTSDDYINVGLQRQPQFGDRLFFTEEEMAQRNAQIQNQAKNDLQEFANPDARVGTGPPGHWGERARRAPRQTSLIVDPADGRMPALTPDGRERDAWARANIQGAGTSRPADSWEGYSYYIRCITRGVAGSMLPVIYGNGTEIVQGPGYVAIMNEMVHEARIIPLDGRPHVGSNIRSYMGDSRGRWEGNTLVVETTNFLHNKTGIGPNGGGPPTSDALRLVERFTRTAPDELYYELDVDDPKTFTRPFKIAFPIRQVPGYKNFEYACHEGNHGMMNQLSAARAQEKAAEEAAKKGQQ